MDALISGQAGIAIFLQGNITSVIGIDDPSREFPHHYGSISYLLAGTTDVVELKSVSKNKALDELMLAWQRDRALHLALISLDPEEKQETRQLAIEDLEELLRGPEVYKSVANRLYSEPFPFTFGLEEARILAQNFQTAFSFIENLQRDQNQIRLSREAWDRVPLELFGSPRAREEFESGAVNSGAFRIIVEALSERSGFGPATFKCYSDMKHLPNSRAIIRAWLGPLTPKKSKPSEMKIPAGSVEASRVHGSERDRAPSKVSPYDAFQNVNKQKEAIITLFNKGDIQRARKFIDQLINSQMVMGGPEYASKSLCDLAQQAKELIHDYPLQLELAMRAVELVPEDGWAHGQVGDAYFCLGELDNAWHSFDTASKLGKPAFGKSGQARVLRAKGNLGAALEAYNKIIAEYPDEVEAWSARAETLREMWRLDEALDAYNKTVERFPTERIPHCGRAAVLKDLGRLDDALTAYQKIIDEFDERVAYAGRADVLKEMGQFEESAKAYAEATQRFPAECVLKCGTAEMLKEKGELTAALVLYNQATELFPLEPVPWGGRAELLKHLGRFEDALAAFNEAIEKFPYETQIWNGRANLLKKVGKLEDALQAYDQIISKFPYDVFARSGRADLLKELGYLEKAAEAYEVLRQCNPNKRSIGYSKAAILVALGRYEEARRLLPIEKPRTRDEWVAYHINCMILLKSDKLDTAVEKLTWGLRLNPFANQRRYFENALTVATLRQRKLEEALAFVGSDQEPMTDVLRIHAFGELRRIGQAKEAYQRVSEKCPLQLVPLRDELAAYYGLRPAQPEHQREWVFEQECRSVLLQAA